MPADNPQPLDIEDGDSGLAAPTDEDRQPAEQPEQTSPAEG
jgi:hypothetical protein